MSNFLRFAALTARPSKSRARKRAAKGVLAVETLDKRQLLAVMGTLRYPPQLGSTSVASYTSFGSSRSTSTSRPQFSTSSFANFATASGSNLGSKASTLGRAPQFGSFSGSTTYARPTYSSSIASTYTPSYSTFGSSTYTPSFSTYGTSGSSSSSAPSLLTLQSKYSQLQSTNSELAKWGLPTVSVPSSVTNLLYGSSSFGGSSSKISTGGQTGYTPSQVASMTRGGTSYYVNEGYGSSGGYSSAYDKNFSQIRSATSSLVDMMGATTRTATAIYGGYVAPVYSLASSFTNLFRW